MLTPAANPVAAATSGDTSVSITAYLPAGATGTGSASGSVEFNVNGTAASSSPLAPLTANALQFSGSSSSYLAASSSSTGLPSGTQARTISTWFNPASSAGSGLHEILGYGSTSSAGELYGIAAGVVSGNKEIQISTGGTAATVTATLTTSEAANWANDWHHLVVVLPAGGSLASTAIYLDGNELTTTGGSGSFSTAAGPLVIGGGVTGGAGPFSGDVGPTMIFSRAFGAGQVRLAGRKPGRLLRRPRPGGLLQPERRRRNHDRRPLEQRKHPHGQRSHLDDWPDHRGVRQLHAVRTRGQLHRRGRLQRQQRLRRHDGRNDGKHHRRADRADHRQRKRRGRRDHRNGGNGRNPLSVYSPNFFDDLFLERLVRPTTGSGSSPYASGHGTLLQLHAGPAGVSTA